MKKRQTNGGTVKERFIAMLAMKYKKKKKQ